MLSVSVNKLRNEVKAREDRKMETFNKVLDMCYQKILNTNKTSDECCCVFICPQIIFGLPLFNLSECINFIMQKLVEKGFEVYLAIPNHIHISWQTEEQKSKSTPYSLQYPSLQYHHPQQNLLIEPTYNSQHTKQSYQQRDNYSQQNQRRQNRNNSSHTLGYGDNNGRNTTKKEKNYRPIDEYQQISKNIYNTDDIELFQNKIDELFT